MTDKEIRHPRLSSGQNRESTNEFEGERVDIRTSIILTNLTQL